MRTLLLFIILSIPSSVAVIDPGTHREKERVETIHALKQSEFSESSLVQYLILKDAPDYLIIYSQFILETGWFTSKLFLEGNNLAGMKMPARRKTTAKGVIYGHARYDHWTDSVDDFLLWLDFHSLSEGYAEELKSKGYAENPEYYTKIMNIYTSLKI